MQDEHTSIRKDRAEELFQDAIPLAIGIATHYANIPGATLDELRAEARLAAWHAAQSFDESRGAEFPNYVGRVVRNHLKSVFRKETTRKKHIPRSLDYQFAEDETDTLIDTIPGEGNSVLDHVCINEAAVVLRALVAELPDRQQQYALALMNGEVDANTARQMGITKQSLHAIKQKALSRLRSKLAEHDVRASEQLQSAPRGRIRKLPQEISTLPMECVLDLLLPSLVD